MGNQGMKKVVVVLGAGRSGTSLLMHVLSRQGMRLSDRLVPPKAHNKDGPMEDAEIAQIYDDVILQQIGSTRTLPFPDDISQEEIFRCCGKKLVDIVTRNAAFSSQIWGFKDPYTSCLLPLWHRVFNVAGVVPVFILAVRNPASSVVSRKKHFGVNDSLGELAWLVNYVEALHHTSLDLFVVHYEDWFGSPLAQASDLADYVGLSSGAASGASVVEMIDPVQNHSDFDDYTIQNEYVNNLYSVLKMSKGAAFDRKLLMGVVKDCRKAMSGFKGWYFEAHKYISLCQKKDRELPIKVSNEVAVVASKNEGTVSALEADLATLVGQNNQLLQEVMLLKSEKQELFMQIQNEKSKLADLGFIGLFSLLFKNRCSRGAFVKKLFKMRDLVSIYQIKKTLDFKSNQKILKFRRKFILGKPDSNLIRVKFSDALRHPGKNTVLFPLKFIKYLLEIVSHKFRTK